jgi:hypothetical protein
VAEAGAPAASARSNGGSDSAPQCGDAAPHAVHVQALCRPRSGPSARSNAAAPPEVAVLPRELAAQHPRSEARGADKSAAVFVERAHAQQMPSEQQRSIRIVGVARSFR